jgi:predicted outer membrane repeat protein
MAISGCKGTAVSVTVDATGAYTAAATLSNISLTGNSGTWGSALYVGPAAAASLQAVTVSGNTAAEGVMYAAARSSLALTGCTVSGNTASALVFAGSSLTVTNSSFFNNAAVRVLEAPSASALRNRSSGGALRLLCYAWGPGGYDSLTTITNSSFLSNRGLHGGAVYAGEGTTLQLRSVSFRNNSGYNGGAVFTDRDACLQSMANTSFTLNTARERCVVGRSQGSQPEGLGLA